MPILDVDDSHSVIVIKRSMNPGFAGIENELYYDPKTAMLFGDAKAAVSEITAELPLYDLTVRALCETAVVIARDQALAALSHGRVRRRGRRRRDHRGRGRARRRHARLQRRALERADFASGTSSRSSKLVHGGLRYLQNFDLGLVREALLERQLMVALAPHLVHPLPLVVPAFDGARPDRLMGVGLNLYDVMSVDRDRLRARRAPASAHERRARVGQRARGTAAEQGESWSPERHRVISGEEVLELLPALAAREPTSGYLFYDCQTDDVRLVLTVLGEAERFGAVCANRVGGDRPAGARRPRARRAVRAMTESGESSRCGPRTSSTRPGCGPTSCDRTSCTTRPSCRRSGRAAARTSRSRHEDLPLAAGAIVPAGAGRTIFALPWLGRTLVGTTDNDYDGELEHVQPSERGRRLPAGGGQRVLRDRARRAGAHRRVRRRAAADLTGDPKKSVDISRKAELYETSSGMITITGGKLTTWRRMAKLTVDRLVERDARDAPCRTHEIPLGQAIAVEELPRVAGVPEASYAALAARYGYAAHEVLALAAERRRARPADRPRASRPARRGRARGPPRAGAQHRRRAAAPYAPRPARRARARGRRARGAVARYARRRRARGRARLERHARDRGRALPEEARAEGLGDP